MNDQMLDEQLRSLARFTDDEVRALDLGGAEAELLAAVLAQIRAGEPFADAGAPGALDEPLVPVELLPAAAPRRSRRRLGWAVVAIGSAAALVASIAIGSASDTSRVIVQDPGRTSEPSAAPTTVATATTGTSSTTSPTSAAPTVTLAPTVPTIATTQLLATDPGTTVAAPEPTTVPEPPTQETGDGLVEPPSSLATGTTIPLPLQPSAGSYNFVSVATAGQLLVWSPVDRAGVAVDPVAGTTRPIAPLPFDVARSTSQGWAPVRGGALVWADASSSFYDPVQNTWSAPQAMPEARILGLTTAAGDRIMVCGGSSTGGSAPPALDLLLWSATSRTWTRSSPAPSGGRAGLLSSAVVGDVVYFDGETGQDSVPILAYHLSTDTWTQLSPPVALPYAPYIVGGGGRLLVLALDHTVSAVFDPAAGTWSTATPSMAVNHGRHSASAVAVGSNFVYVDNDGFAYGYGPSGWATIASLPIGGAGVFVVGDHLVVPGVTTGSVATWAAAAWIVPLDQIRFR